MENLGKIGVTFAFADKRADLLAMLTEMVKSIPPEQEQFDRIVLIVPDKVWERLGWSAERVPRVEIHASDLVFTLPAPCKE